MRRKHSSIEEEAEVDMTPMLDIVFIMLIFFIVTTSFVKESGLDVNRPSAAPPTKSKEKTPNIIIKIDDLDEIMMDGRSVDIRAVGANLETKKAEFPKTTVTISAHNESVANTLIEVVNAAKAAGIENISVANPAN
ncbi:MAG: biopolymer transporter ExbD [Pseudomonadota bacterium]